MNLKNGNVFSPLEGFLEVVMMLLDFPEPPKTTNTVRSQNSGRHTRVTGPPKVSPQISPYPNPTVTGQLGMKSGFYSSLSYTILVECPGHSSGLGHHLSLTTLITDNRRCRSSCCSQPMSPSLKSHYLQSSGSSRSTCPGLARRSFH